MDRILTLLVVLVLGVTACGSDDGTGVRELGSEEGASGSAASGSTASGSAASGSSASGSAAEDVTCNPVGEPTADDRRVEVALAEYTLEPAETELEAGRVVFAAVNNGEEPHELLIARGPLADLPTDADGAVPEDGIELVDEIEPFPHGETCEGAFELEAGTYSLICNIVEVEDGVTEAHYAEGMAAEITVI